MQDCPALSGASFFLFLLFTIFYSFNEYCKQQPAAASSCYRYHSSSCSVACSVACSIIPHQSNDITIYSGSCLCAYRFTTLLNSSNVFRYRAPYFSIALALCLLAFSIGLSINIYNIYNIYSILLFSHDEPDGKFFDFEYRCLQYPRRCKFDIMSSIARWKIFV